MKRFKYTVRFNRDEIPLIAEGLLLVQENYANEKSDKKFFKIGKMIDHCYINEESQLDKNIQYLLNRGYIVKKEVVKNASKNTR